MERGFFFFVLLSSCAALEPPPELKPPPDLTLKHVLMRHFKGGQPTALAAIDVVEYTRDTGHIEATNAALWPVTGSLAGGTLRAGLAVGNTRTGKGVLSEGTHWLGPSGDRLETATCTLDLANQIARGDDPVTMFGNGYKLDAVGFESRYGAGEAQFHGGVHVSMAEDMLDNPGAVP